MATKPDGYDKLSSYMTDEGYTIFRKFGKSANRDLLYLQAEIAQLEDELSGLSIRDRNTNGERGFYDRNWYLLSTSKARGCDGEQWEKIIEIRRKLREYYDCVSLYSTMMHRSKPRKRDVSMLKEWMLREDLGGGISFSGEDLSPHGNMVYGDTYYDDLMILNNRVGEDDPFSRFLAGPVFHGFERMWRLLKQPVPADVENQSAESNLFHYSDAHVLGVIDLLGTVMASMAPLVSIVVLYFVRNLGVRLGILCACTLLFSFSLALVTKARRIEIFACTAAFASVQLVFVGSTSNSYQT